MVTEFCVFCGNNNHEELEVHHVLPRVMGGTDDIRNLLTACGECHGMVHEITRPKNLKELSRLGRERAYTSIKPKTEKKKRFKAYLITRLNGVQFCITGTQVSIAKYLGITKLTFQRYVERSSKETQQDPRVTAQELVKQYSKTKVAEMMNITRKTLDKYLQGVKPKKLRTMTITPIF